MDAAAAADDLDGKVDKILVNAVLSSRPLDRLTANFKFNYYDDNDASDRIPWENG